MDLRYPGCKPCPGSTDRHGQVENPGDLEVTHWFVEVARIESEWRHPGVAQAVPFSHLEKPEAVSQAIRRFFEEDSR